MKFKTVLLSAVALFLFVCFGGVAVVLTVTSKRDALRQIDERLHRAAVTLQETEAFRRVLYDARARLVADEPRLKAVVATEDVDYETVYGVLFDLNRSIAADLFIVTSAAGRLLGDALEPAPKPLVATLAALLEPALDDRAAPALCTVGASTYVVFPRGIRYGSDIRGVLLLGYAVTHETLAVVQRQTGGSLLLHAPGQPPLAWAGFAEGTAENLQGLADAVTSAGGPREVRDERGHAYVALAVPWGGVLTDKGMRYVVLRSLDDELETVRRLAWWIGGIAAAALGLATAIFRQIAARLSRPVEGLTAFAQRIAANDLREHVSTDGPTEIVQLAVAMNIMAREIGASRQAMLEKERLESTLAVAAQVQRTVLPRAIAAPNLEVATLMQPAENIGGDYYDILAVPGGAWIAVGDVSGHGLSAGMIMLMVQSALATAVAYSTMDSPAEVLKHVNRILYSNIRDRMQGDDFVTLLLVRYWASGRCVYAGGHEDIILRRKGSGGCETFPIVGPWVGAALHVEELFVDQELTLHPGDVMVLFTDGVTEAMNQEKRLFGLERLCAEVSKSGDMGASDLLGQLYGAVVHWRASQADDETLVVIRYKPEATGVVG